MSEIPVLEDLETALGGLDGKRILVRTDFNVPLDDTSGSAQIVDDFRIRAALPTIEWLTERGATVVTASHLGRPKGAPDPKYSMDPVRARLAELAPGVELLENLRFDPGETSNAPAFVATLVDGIDGYVNDAFGASHRAHASIVGPPRFVPSAMGRLLQKEVEVLLGLRNKPKHPFVAVLGGAKISDKLGVVEALLDVVDALVRSASRGSGLVINVGTGDQTSIADLWTHVAGAVAGADALVPTHGPARLHDVQRFAVAPVRARIHLGWSPWTDLADGLGNPLPASGGRRGNESGTFFHAIAKG